MNYFETSRKQDEDFLKQYKAKARNDHKKLARKAVKKPDFDVQAFIRALEKKA